MSDDGTEEVNKKEIEEEMEYYESDSDSYQSDDSIKEAGLYVTSIANLRRREMHGISSYLDMSSTNSNEQKVVEIQEKKGNLATLKATQKLI